MVRLIQAGVHGRSCGTIEDDFLRGSQIAALRSFRRGVTVSMICMKYDNKNGCDIKAVK
jgi:hypothetical protein